MTRRRFQFLVAAAATCSALSLAWSGVAWAQGGPTPGFAIEHDDSLAPGDMQSDFFQLLGNDVSLSPDEQREGTALTLDGFDANANFTPPVDPDPTDDAGWGWERREIVIPEGDVNGSMTVTIRWGDPTIDFDLYIYRQRTDGTIDGTPVASSAQGGTTEETATFTPDRVDIPLRPGTYWAYIDNWCSGENDPLDAEIEENFGDFCTPDPATAGDEDDWIGTVTFAPLVLQNQKPVVHAISGPAAGTTGQELTYAVSATDPEAPLAPLAYAFDLDGDGRFEYDNGRSNVVKTKYDTAGVRNLGVRVIDERGGVTYASMPVTITGPPQPPGPPKLSPGLVKTFRLNRPVFGGTKKRKLALRYEVREQSRVSISLYRGGKRVRRLVRNQVRMPGRAYRLTLRPRGLKRGIYTLRLSATSAGGKVQRATLTAKRL